VTLANTSSDDAAQRERFLAGRPKDGFGARLKSRWYQRSRFWGVLVLWTVAMVGVILGLFLWVAARQRSSVAFDLLFQHASAVGSKSGIPGVLLSVLGFIAVPAIVAALVAAMLMRSSQISPKAEERLVARVASRLTAIDDPQPLTRAAEQAFSHQAGPGQQLK